MAARWWGDHLDHEVVRDALQFNVALVIPVIIRSRMRSRPSGILGHLGLANKIYAYVVTSASYYVISSTLQLPKSISIRNVSLNLRFETCCWFKASIQWQRGA